MSEPRRESDDEDWESDEPEWKDAMPLLIAGTQQLPKGELILAEGRTLEDIMSAIKIMDPRLDMGMEIPIDPTSTANLLPEFDPSVLLQPFEVIEIMDRILCLEMTWHTGHSLAQTVYTLRYLHQLPEIISYNHHNNNSSNQQEDIDGEILLRVLRCYVVGLAKCCSLVWYALVQGNLYENEDVNTDRAGVRLCEQWSDEEAIQELNLAHNWLHSWTGPVGEKYKIALMTRLRFRIEYLTLLNMLHVPTSMLSDFDPRCQSAFQSLDSLEFVTLKAPMSDLVKVAFDPSIARRLPMDMPLRPIVIKTKVEARCLAKEMILDLRKCVGLSKGWRVLKWQEEFEALSRREQVPLPYVRTSMSTYFYSKNVIARDLTGRRNVAWLGRQFFLELTGYNLDPLTIGPGQREAGLRYFVSKVAGLLVGWLTCLCFNRSRAKRKMVKNLRVWRQLYDEAVTLAQDQPGLARLRLAVAYIHLSITIEAVLAGFDIETYDPLEVLCMRWVASQFLEAKVTVMEALEQELSLTHVVHLHRHTLACTVTLQLIKASMLISCMDGGLSDISSEIRRQHFEVRLKWHVPENNLPEDVIPTLITFEAFLAWQNAQSQRQEDDMIRDLEDALNVANEGLESARQSPHIDTLRCSLIKLRKWLDGKSIATTTSHENQPISAAVLDRSCRWFLDEPLSEAVK